MAFPTSTILKSLIAALPGLLALIKAFKRTEEPTSADITDKASSEIRELESWKTAAKEEDGI